MGCAISSAAGCCASLAGSAIGSCCCSLGCSSKGTVNGAKIGYFFIMVLSTCLSILFRYWGADHIDLAVWKINCNMTEGGGSGGHHDWDDLTRYQHQYTAACKGNAAVYRISLMTAFFFLIMAVGSCAGKTFHVGFWAPKMLLYVGLITMSFFLPNYVFDDSGYAWLSRVASFFFLLAQITILVDFGYKWNDSWVAAAQEEEAGGHPGCAPGCCGGWCGSGNRYYAGILGACGACYTFWIVGISLMFKYYTCETSQAFISITLILVLIMTVAQLATPDSGALLPSAVVSAYCTYLCWSAVANNPDAKCFPSTGIGSHNDNPGLLFAGIVVTGASLAWTCNSAANALPGLFAGSDESEDSDTARSGSYLAETSVANPTSPRKPKNPTKEEASGDGVEVALPTSSDDDKVDLEGGRVAVPAQSRDDQFAAKEDAAAQNIWLFHLIMMIGAVYMAMLLTNWGSDQNDAATVINDGSSPTKGNTAMWITIITQWIAIALYMWTLCAPRLMPGRDFS